MISNRRRVKQKRKKKKMMDEMTKNQPSHWWWLDTTTTNRSPWLQSTLSELNEKTKAMLKVIEEDADSFAKRAEMYYKKRPELLRMVEDFYRTHRSLAERYDQVRPETGIGLLNSGGSPFASAKHRFEKLLTFADDHRGYDTYSESYDVESEVDDPEQEVEEEEEESKSNHKEEVEVSYVAVNDEVIRLRDEMKRLNEENKAQKDQLKMKDSACDEVIMLREEIERLKEENEAQREQLKQKDEEKIEVIRQLSMAIDVMKEENVKMRNFIVAKESTKKWNKKPFEFNKFVGELSEKFFNFNFNVIPKNEPSVELSRRGLTSLQIS
ncbi:protein NETWORKED 3A isoform X1 [Arachis ipaensis]|uniref:NAB domain-containing protein n=2 Tax=Arachis TaxID=3817 RepID=A0A444YI81_ARAHY|nr:protein NETWORKED 3A isoform X1 [Arachis ipaensis]XP_025662541.1 protein NETWORKED 3A isoform X1 [Arachis hypogaea]QHN84669.1 Protein NETWORKED 3A [Arachis hypogaea]RYR01604.1 hypothetical protein Ahy_B06g080484 [Arachis hypogaea]